MCFYKLLGIKIGYRCRTCDSSFKQSDVFNTNPIHRYFRSDGVTPLIPPLCCCSPLTVVREERVKFVGASMLCSSRTNTQRLAIDLNLTLYFILSYATIVNTVD